MQRGEPPLRAQPRKGESGIGPCGDHEMQQRGQMVEQEGQPMIACLGRRPVVVIQHERDGIGSRCQRVGEDRQGTLYRRRTRRFEQTQRRAAQARLDAIQGSEHISPEAYGVSFRLFERNPGDRPAALLEPLAGHHEERCLAKSRWRSQQGAGTFEALQAALHDCRAGNERKTRVRHGELRSDQRGGLPTVKAAGSRRPSFGKDVCCLLQPGHCQFFHAPQIRFVQSAFLATIRIPETVTSPIFVSGSEGAARAGEGEG